MKRQNLYLFYNCVGYTVFICFYHVKSFGGGIGHINTTRTLFAKTITPEIFMPPDVEASHPQKGAKSRNRNQKGCPIEHNQL